MKRIFFSIILVLFVLMPLYNVVAWDDYHFAVLGDRTGGANHEAFLMVLRDIEMLQPDFIVAVGDIIEGYCDKETARKRWDEIFESLRVITCPIFITPGNHDIFDKESEEVFIEKTGFPPYYTFDFENTHFVILNNAVAENVAQMGKEQLEWLEEDLRENRGIDNIFVFMHKPFWAHGIGKGKEDKLHNIFKENNVDAVFTGHWHQFASNEYDGIRYILVGSSGGSWTGKENVELGMFYQFLWCKVEGDKFYPSLIKAGNIYDMDLVTIEEEMLSYDIYTRLISFEAERISGQDYIDVGVNIVNNTDKVLKSDIIIEYDENWEVEPNRKSIEIEKGDTLESHFEFIRKGDFYPIPRMNFIYPFGRDKNYEYSRAVWIKKNVECPTAINTPVIDGKMNENEWKGAGIALDFADFEGNETRVDDTKVYFMHDDENLYIFAFCHDKEMDKLKTTQKNRDDPVYGDDCVGFLLSGDENSIIHIYISAIGTIWDQKVDMEKEEADLNWNGNYEVKCSRDKENWVMEIKVPFEEIGITESDKEIKMNIRRKQQRNSESAVWMLDWAYNPSRFGGLLLK